MAQAPDYNRLRKMTKIYLVIQIFLVVLLIFMAFRFQAKFVLDGNAKAFTGGIIIATVMQLAIFWPIRKFALYEADREIESIQPNLDGDKLKSLRVKRMTGDIVKSAVFVFYLIFLVAMPNKKGVTSILWPVFLTFILTYLTYFQCVTYALKKGIANRS
jgi:hypothetical protein